MQKNMRGSRIPPRMHEGANRIFDLETAPSTAIPNNVAEERRTLVPFVILISNPAAVIAAAMHFYLYMLYFDAPCTIDARALLRSWLNPTPG